MNPFLQSLQPIWNNPLCVSLNQEAIGKLAVDLAADALPTPDWRAAVFPVEDDTAFINFIGVANSINFAFTEFSTFQDFSVDYRHTTWAGAFAMFACLLRALERGIDISNGHFLAKLEDSTAEKIFQGRSRIPMLSERAAIFREVGAVLAKRYGGFFSNLFEEANFKAFGEGGIIDRLVSEFPSFADESRHASSGTVLKFHKRAQLLPMMYQGRALSSSKLTPLADFHDLGPIADYAVPRALRLLNILQYSPELQRQISQRKLIPRDSVQEQEIRAQTAHAQFELLTKLNSTRSTPTTMLALDFKLWSMGEETKAAEPHHLTVTTAY